MTDDEIPVAFTGFAGMTVPVPTWPADEYDPVTGSDGDIQEHFQREGVTHADSIMTQYVADLLHEQVPTFDLTAMLTTFTPAPAREHIVDEDVVDYITGFTQHLADVAEFIDQVRAAPDRLDFYGSGDQAWMRSMQSLLTDDELRTLGERAEAIARAVCQHTDRPLPPELTLKDLLLQEKRDDLRHLVTLSELIDQYSQIVAEPGMRSSDPTEQNTLRDELVAQIAVLDTVNPHLAAGLSEDRAAVLHQLVPAAAERAPSARTPAAVPVPSDPDLVRMLAAQVERYSAGLRDAETGPAAAAAAHRIAELHSRNPNLATALPTDQAGLVRLIAARTTLPTTAPGIRNTNPSAERTRPGTAAARHTAPPAPPGRHR